ncbi:MAG: metal ABC transporter permease, partial [Actinomycetota bacterium]
MNLSFALADSLWGPFARNEFMQNALLASSLVAIICAIAGTYVVLRGLSFVGDALAHGVIPGIALALLFGIPGVVGAAVGALVMMGGVSVITTRVRLSADTAIGLLFVGMLSLGVIITSRSTSFVGDITRILFGELLGVTRADLAWQSVV